MNCATYVLASRAANLGWGSVAVTLSTFDCASEPTVTSSLTRDTGICSSLATSCATVGRSTSDWFVAASRVGSVEEMTWLPNSFWSSWESWNSSAAEAVYMSGLRLASTYAPTPATAATSTITHHRRRSATTTRDASRSPLIRSNMRWPPSGGCVVGAEPSCQQEPTRRPECDRARRILDEGINQAAQCQCHQRTDLGCQ